MAASVWMKSSERPFETAFCRPTALTTPTVTVFDSSKGLPMAMTQSPGAICDESPNFAAVSGAFGISVSCSSAVSVSSSRPMIFAGKTILAVLHGRQVNLNGRGVFHDVVVRQDEAGLVDDEAASGSERRSWRLGLRRGLATPAAKPGRERKAKEFLGFIERRRACPWW